MPHFYTIQEAAELLDIDRKTLYRWLKKYKITVKTSPIDGRAAAISDTQLSHIRDIRAPYLPLKSTSHRPIVAPQLPRILRKKSEPKEQNHVNSELPAGYISYREWARRHNIPETTISKAIATGRLMAVNGHWKHGRTYVDHALDDTAQQAAYDLWSHSERFQACEHCPSHHAE